MALRARSPAGAGAPRRRAEGLRLRRSAGSTATWGRGRRFAAATRTAISSSSITKPNGIRRPPELKPALKNQAQRFPRARCQCAPARSPQLSGRRHPELTASSSRIISACRTTEQIVLNDGSEAAMWMTMSNKSYDFAYTRDHYGKPGPLPPRHLRARQPRGNPARRRYLSRERPCYIETGPHKHAIQQTFFLYVWEPGGNRVEVANAGARLILAPDWKPIVWTRGGAQEGSGLGIEDDRVVSHPRHAAGRSTAFSGEKHSRLTIFRDVAGLVTVLRRS